MAQDELACGPWPTLGGGAGSVSVSPLPRLPHSCSLPATSGSCLAEQGPGKPGQTLGIQGEGWHYLGWTRWVPLRGDIGAETAVKWEMELCTSMGKNVPNRQSLGQARRQVMLGVSGRGGKLDGAEEGKARGAGGS